MTVKITNQCLRSSGEHRWKTGTTGTTLWSGARLLGPIKNFDGSTGGYFIPNQLKLNPCNISKGLGVCTPTLVESYQTNYSSYKNTWEGQFACDSLTTAYYEPIDTVLGNYALVKATAKLQSADADVALMLGELSETLRLLKNPLNGLLSLIKKRDGRSAANFWLEYRYGILPLISDIQSLINVFNGKVRDHSEALMSCRGSIATQKDYPTKFTSTGFDGLYWKRAESKAADIKATSIVYYNWILGVEANALKYGFDLTQMPALAWELVPYSFVVDWFLQIGSWLAAISPHPYLTVKGNCTSYKITSTKVVTLSDFSASYNTITSVSPGSFIWTANNLVRVVNSSLPAAPVFNPTLFTLTRWTDTLSLLWQQVNRRLRRH